MSRTELTLLVLLIAAAATIGVQLKKTDDFERAAYKQGVSFGHRCVNASIAQNDNKTEAAEYFRHQAESFARFGWKCQPGESLLLQEAHK